MFSDDIQCCAIHRTKVSLNAVDRERGGLEDVSVVNAVPPSAIGFSIILLILTDPPHASVHTSILGESDGGALAWMSLLDPSATQTPDHRAAVAARLPIWAAATYLAGPKASSWYHVGQRCHQYRPPGSRSPRGSVRRTQLPPGRRLIGLKSKTAYTRSTQALRLSPPRGKPRSLISNKSRAC
ncbi:hypothetical protein OPT61_g8462 [Boeremia exigua]|uniref:Uncharacterized protein n=1 Tax=Boeremia exigua TaxID=749465 RepID=A0ACC2HY45_9PLEO|nr:hypothetical protein OPT61_g8462 [Boeremia exigua]